MIIVGVALIALVGFMAFSLDFGRMYLYRTQVHVSSDAAALAGTDRLARQLFVGAADTAVAYGRANKVENAIPDISVADIEPGVWNFTTRSFTPAAGGSWTATGNNAVRATARYTAGYVFGRAFGFTTKLRTATSVAAVGGAGGTSCVRPVAVPYQILLDVLYAPGSKDPATYALTTNDVERLAAMTIADNILLKVGDASGTIVNGNFYAIRMPPVVYASGASGSPWSGGSNYADALGATCAELDAKLIGQGAPNAMVSVGDWLRGENGNMVGPTGDGFSDLCAANGGTTPPNAKGNKDYTCNAPVSVKIAIWSTVGDPPGGSSGCGNRCFQVRYLGIFAVTGFKKGEGIYGYFSSLTSSGVFTPLPGPIKKVALVQ